MNLGRKTNTLSLESQMIEADMLPENILRSQGYKIGTKISKGTYSKIFIAEYNDGSTKLKLACKVIDVAAVSPTYVKDCLPREIDILMKISHPYIVRIYSIYRKNNIYFHFMRFAENGNLSDCIYKYGAVKEDHARVWARQIALGLQYLHTLEIAHRDLKCENILCTYDYNMLICDFSYSRFVVNHKNMPMLSNSHCGTFHYISPEIFDGFSYNPKAADMWALGIVFFKMLNETTPFTEKNYEIMRKLQVTKTYKFNHKLIDLSNEAKELIDKLLEPKVKQRYKIKDVINCNWFKMDERLSAMSLVESSALSLALEQVDKMEFKPKKRNWLETEPYHDLTELTIFKKIEPNMLDMFK